MRGSETEHLLTVAEEALAARMTTDATDSWLRIRELEPETSSDYCYATAMLCIHGLGDRARGLVWMRQAADQNHGLAMCWLGVENSLLGDEEGAKEWWLAAAETGDAGSMIYLGFERFYAGDITGARDWWNKVSAGSHPHADTCLGMLAAMDGAKATARRIWEGVIEKWPDGNAFFGLGMLAMEDDDPGTAQEMWEHGAVCGNAACRRKLSELANRP